MTPECELWAFENKCGDQAAVWIAERIGTLACEYYATGVTQWKMIAEELSILWTGDLLLPM